MNIKGFGLTNLIPIDFRKKADSKAPVKTDANTERDADGRSAGGDGTGGELTEEQLKKAIEQLKNLPAVKEHGFQVQRTESNGHTIILISDALGKVIRRIPKNQILLLLQSQPEEGAKGQLYDKAL